MRTSRAVYHLLLAPICGYSHAARLESFYGRQASIYDESRASFLHGRREMYSALPVPEGGIWIDMGAGTGWNLEHLGDRLHRLAKIYLVDLSPSMLDVARERIRTCGWTNVEVIEADVSAFDLPGVLADVVTFSYSLTMIPDWFAAVDQARRLLRPGGAIGVVDFYVSRKYPAADHVRHSWFTRTFLPACSLANNIFLSPDHVPYLHRHLQAQHFSEHRVRSRWMPMPYYIFIGTAPPGPVGPRPDASRTVSTSWPPAAPSPRAAGPSAPDGPHARPRVRSVSESQSRRSVKTVLLTGGRSLGALELARVFHANGFRVIMADSPKWYLSRPSRAIARNYVLSPPNRHPRLYASELLEIVQRERVDLLVPTCEEVFFIAMHRDLFDGRCVVFADCLETLGNLHSKWAFVNRARLHGLKVPSTSLIDNKDALRAALHGGRDLVLKPVFSRYGTHTVIGPRGHHDVSNICPTGRRPWVAQDFVDGRPLCTYSVVQEGRITAHSAYTPTYSFDHGPAFAFRYEDHPGGMAWVSAFVREERFTGQIGIDFIETKGGDLFAIECNPRTTSGVHFFSGTPEFPGAFVDASCQIVRPNLTQPRMLAGAMVLHALKSIRSARALREWCRTYWISQDVLFGRRDPWPFVLQGLIWPEILSKSRRLGISLREAITSDMEWNGEE